MEDIAWFKELSKDDIPLVGGKGANLGEMYNAGLPIPPGFAVTSEAFRKFITGTKIDKQIFEILSKTNVDNNDELDSASIKAKNIIMNTEMQEDLKGEIKEAYENLNVNEDVIKVGGQALDIIKSGREQPFVAVRSSATAEDLPSASFAGQQETFLNIRGTSNLLKAVQKCWASLYTPRAIYYRVKNNFPHDKVLIAVIVQKMVKSEKSGVMFSINPATNNEDEIMIETGWGLGEAVVSGSISPDQYIIDKGTLQLKDKIIREQTWMFDLDTNLGQTVKKDVPEYKKKKQKLNDNEIRTLAELSLKIENHYGKPQDMEYAIEGNKVYMVQTRPVTTLKKLHVDEMEEGEAELMVSGLGASPGIGIGPVRIVHEMDELGKINKGDVMVTRMTTPDLVHALQRATAIVTDAGGTTCFEGKTKIFTNKGFMTMEEAYKTLSKRDELKVLSLNPKTLKTEWKKAKNPIKREAGTIRITASQTGRSYQNYIQLTPNHKMFYLKNRQPVEKGIGSIIKESGAICIIDKIPEFNNPHIIDEPKLAYLCGAIFSDGHTKVNDRRGFTIFTQKETPEKIEFINTVKECFYDTFKVCMDHKRVKNTIGTIRGRKISGTATDFINCRKIPALHLKNIRGDLVDWVLHLNEESLLSFIAGILDGDGTSNKGCPSGRFNIYSGKKDVCEGVIIALLRLGIMPQISIQRQNCLNIQINERLGELLKKTKRVKQEITERRMGQKLFSAKELLGDKIEECNWMGRIRPYVDKNLLLDGKKIRERVLPLIKDPNTQEEINKILNSDIRMWRASQLPLQDYTEVYNFEVEDNHTYIVFTKNYTPIAVWNCHAAIVSREMGIPCVVGTEKATQVLKEDEIVSVNGSTGKVYKGRIKVEEKKDTAQERGEDTTEAMIQVETSTEIKVIMDLPDFAEKAAATGADGVGLLRNNLMLAKHGEHPSYMIRNGKKEQLVQTIVKDVSKIAEAFKGKPVWYRTFDAPTDEYRNMKGGEEEPVEQNPMMGWRSIRRSLDEPELLKAEFEAIKRIHDKGLTNVGIMIPLVISIEEVRRSKEMLGEFGLEQGKNIEFGVMVETPASVQIIEEICEEGIDFISFGTNDLTQFTLAIDRDNAKVAKLYSEKHPAVLRQIKHVIDICKKYNVKTSICGQAGSDPEMAEILVKMGIDSITANVDAVHKIRNIVGRIEKKLVLNAARKDLKI